MNFQRWIGMSQGDQGRVDPERPAKKVSDSLIFEENRGNLLEDFHDPPLCPYAVFFDMRRDHTDLGMSCLPGLSPKRTMASAHGNSESNAKAKDKSRTRTDEY